MHRRPTGKSHNKGQKKGGTTTAWTLFNVEIIQKLL